MKPVWYEKGPIVIEPEGEPIEVTAEESDVQEKRQQPSRLYGPNGILIGN